MSKNRKRSQWIFASVVIFIGIGALYFVSQILNTHQSVNANTGTQSGIDSSIIADRTRATSPEMSWINSASSQIEELTAQVASLSEGLQIVRDNAEQERQAADKETDALLARYENKIKELETHLQRNGNPLPAGQSSSTAALSGASNTIGEFITNATNASPRIPNPLGPFADPSSNVGNGGAVQNGAVTNAPFTRQFTLTPQNVGLAGEEDEAPSYLQNFLPAGSYAPAKVLSGVDASTGVTSQVEPVPVVFRITGPAVTAGTRSTTGHRIDLTGCTVTGSARGDLSSERVYVRLLKLSCVHSDGQVFERDVAGYMSGAGKAGVRGLVVSREGKLVTAAGIAGALGGLAEGVSSIGGAAAEADNLSFNQVLKGAGAASAAGGVSNAANTLSDYYIERAEQYQPVVSLYGGTDVELVFMEGVDLNG